MAMFRLSASTVFSIDGNNVPCPTSITFNEVNDDYVSNCAGSAIKEHVAGLGNITGSFSGEIDAVGAATLGYVVVGTAGALVLRPTGAVEDELDISSTNLQITSLDVAFSSTGLSTYTCNFVCDDLTWDDVPA